MLCEAADLLGVALRDADTRRQIEESERKFRLVAESSQAMIALLQEHGAVYFNPAFVRMTGYTREELATTSLWDIIHPDDVEMIRSYRRRRFSREEAPTRYETRIVTKEGQTRWVDVRASSFELDGRPTVLTTGLNVTERKLAEQDLRASELQLRTLLDHMSDGVVLSVDNKIVYASPGLARMLGATVEQVVGRHPLDNLTPRDRQRAADRLELASQGETAVLVEYELLRNDGGTVHVLASSQRIEFEGRVAVLSVVRDLSEQRELEEQLRQTQRLESVGQLAGGVAHNFNNALAAIIGYAELTLREVPEDHTVHEDVKQILTVAEQSASLTQQLLTFSRKERISPTVFSLNDAIELAAALVGPLLGETIQLTVNLGDALGESYADRRQIEQVVANLAINARDAMEDGGSLTIETSVTSVSEAEARLYPDAQRGVFALLLVRDEGSGMDRETMACIFEPFFTIKEPGQGVGLGLSMVHGAIKQSGGLVAVESAPGSGTTFRLYLSFHHGVPGTDLVSSGSALT